MRYFRGCPVILFENDSSSYLTEKRRIGQTGKSHKRIFEKIQTASNPLTGSHDMVEFHLQKAHEPAFLFPFDFVELQDAVN